MSVARVWLIKTNCNGEGLFVEERLIELDDPMLYEQIFIESAKKAETRNKRIA